MLGRLIATAALFVALTAGSTWAATNTGHSGTPQKPGGPSGTGGSARNPTSTPPPPPPAAEEKEFTGVYKFGSLLGKTLVLTPALPMPGSARIETRNFPDDVATALKDAKAGDLYEVHGVKGKNGLAIKSVSPYTLKPGEDEPNVYIFTQKTTQTVGQADYTAVSASKLGQTFTFLIPFAPGKKGPDKKPLPNEEMLKVVDTLKAGDPAEILAEGAGKTPMIRTIKTYVPFKDAEFVKIARQKVEDKDLEGVEVTIDGASQTIMINPKAANAAILTDKLGGFKAGQAVQVRTFADDTGTWLADIRPKDMTKAQPKDASTTSKPAGGL